MSNLTKLKLIESIVREGNLTAASESLFVSQPYLSKMIKQIEEDIGVSVFERLPRGMKLTYAGERYLEYLGRIQEIEQEALNEMYLIANNKKGTIKIGINPALGTSLLPLVLPPYMSDYPDVKIEIFEENAKDIEDLLEQNKIDIAIGMMAIRSPNLSYEYLYQDNMYLIVNSNSPLYNAEFKGVTPFPYDMAVLNELPLVLLKPEMGIRRLVDDFFEKKSSPTKYRP